MGEKVDAIESWLALTQDRARIGKRIHL